MNQLAKLATTLGPRLIGAVASALAGWLLVHSKGVVQIDANTLVEVTTTMLATYAASHRASSAVINPGDAASGRVAGAVKDAASSETPSNVVEIPPKQP